MATNDSGFLENLREVHGRTIFSLKLPDEYRDQLKNPIGQVYPTDTDNELVNLRKLLLSFYKQKRMIFTVGDVCSKNLVDWDIPPTIMISDGFSKRKPFTEDIEGTLVYQQYVASNQAATISTEAWDTLKKIIYRALTSSSDRFHLKITGEEDLLALPAILEAPLDSLLLYGQPDKGMVVHPITFESKNRVEDILSNFTVVYSE